MMPILKQEVTTIEGIGRNCIQQRPGVIKLHIFQYKNHELLILFILNHIFPFNINFSCQLILSLMIECLKSSGIFIELEPRNLSRGYSLMHDRSAQVQDVTLCDFLFITKNYAIQSKRSAMMIGIGENYSSSSCKFWYLVFNAEGVMVLKLRQVMF